MRRFTIHVQELLAQSGLPPVWSHWVLLIIDRSDALYRRAWWVVLRAWGSAERLRAQFYASASHQHHSTFLRLVRQLAGHRPAGITCLSYYCSPQTVQWIILPTVFHAGSFDAQEYDGVSGYRNVSSLYKSRNRAQVLRSLWNSPLF